MTGFLPPDDPTRRALERELESIEPGGLVIAAAVMVTAVGIGVLVCALQLFVFVELRPALRLVPYGMVANGAGLLFLVARVHGQRTWAAALACVLCAVGTLVQSVWFFFTFWGGLIMPLQILPVPLFFTAMILTAVILPRCRRAADVRRRATTAGLAFYG